MTECPLTKQELLDYGICRSLVKEDNRKIFASPWIRNTTQQRKQPAVSVVFTPFPHPSSSEGFVDFTSL